MDFDELLITTGVDSLIKLVKEQDGIDLIEAANILKLPVQTVREWAQTLEDEGIIRVKYKLAKSYLYWVQPSDDEIEEERSSFIEEKKSLKEEISELKEKLGPEEEHLDDLKQSFKSFYDKIYPKLKELDEHTKKLTEAKETAGSTNYDKRLKELETKLEDLDSMLVFTQSKLNKTQKEILDEGVSVDEFSAFKGMKEEIKAMDNDLVELEKKAYETLKSLPEGSVKYSQLPKFLEKIKKEFAAIKAQSSNAKDYLSKAKKEQEAVKKMKVEFDKNKQGFKTLNKELDEISRVLSKVEEKFSSISKKVEESKKTLAQFGSISGTSESVDTAKVLKRLESIEAAEKSLAEKIAKLEELSEGLSGVANLVKNFDSIRKEIDQKRDKLSETAADIFQRLDEEDETYQVFQTIKEKAVSSIEEYSHQLSSIKSEIQKLFKEIQAIQEQLKKGIVESVEENTDPEVAKTLKKLEKIKEKKALFDEISGSIEKLEETLEGITKRMVLLSKQAELIEIRASKSGGEKTAEMVKEEDEIRNEVELTKSEKLEFENKRRELMKMIKKLWEEE